MVEDTGTTIEELAAEFGPEVARLVGAVSEQKSEGAQPLPWRVRKEAQLEHLRHADRHHRRRSRPRTRFCTTCGQRLSTLRNQGDAVWTRFRGSRTDHLWYYTSLSEILRPILGEHPLSVELSPRNPRATRDKS